MNESLMRDLHDTQIEEIAAVRTAIAELATKPTATPTDIAKVQMMIANIRIPEQDNTPVLRAIQNLSKAGADNATNQQEWLQAIHSQNKQQGEQGEANKALIKECMDRQQQLYTLIESEASTIRMYIITLLLTGILIATFVYFNY
ncbi:MAG: hypothetical protein SNI70_11045 [Rikenellaceae bacterium]